MNEKRKVEELVELAEAVARARSHYGKRGALSFVIWGFYVLVSSFLGGVLGWWGAWVILAFTAGFLDAGRLEGHWARAGTAFGLALGLTVFLGLFVHPAVAAITMGLGIGIGYSVAVSSTEGVSPLLRLVGGLWFFLVLASVSVIVSLKLWPSLQQLAIWAAFIGAGMGVIGFGARSWAYSLGAVLIFALIIAWGFALVPSWLLGVGFGAVLTLAGLYEYWRLSRA